MTKLMFVVGTLVASVMAFSWIWRQYGRHWVFTKPSKAQQRLHRQIYQRIARYPWLAWLLQWWPGSHTQRQRWVLVMGSRHSGKSSLIQRMFAPTKHTQTPWATIFYNRHTVCIEMASQVYRQKQSRQCWHSLLAMIRRYRYRRPLHAILLTIALPELLTADTSHWLPYIERWQQHLLDSKQKLAKDIPVYMVFTKFDALHHFTDFAHLLTAVNRFGFQLTDQHSDASITEAIQQQFTQLEQTLYAWQLIGWQKTTDLPTQLAIYDFPRQFNQCQQRLSLWLTQWLSKAESLPIAGIDFSACPNAPQPIITRAMSDETFAFVATPQQTVISDTNYHLLPAPFVDQVNTQPQKISKLTGMLQHLGLHYTIAGAGLLICWLMCHSALQHAKTILLELHKSRLLIQATSPATVTDVMLQQSIHHHQRLSEQRQQLRWYQHLGFCHAHRLAENLIQQIMHLVQATALQNLPTRLAEMLHHQQTQWATLTAQQQLEQYPSYYAYFKLYTRLSRPTDESIAPLLRYVIQRQLRATNTPWSDEAIDYLVQHYPRQAFAMLPIDYHLVQRVRTDLQTMMLVPAANYQRLLHDLQNIDSRSANVDDHLGLPVLYTLQGWQQIVQPALKRQLHETLLTPLTQAQQHTLGQQMLVLYAKDIDRQWLDWFEQQLFSDLPTTEQALLAWLTTWLDSNRQLATIIRHLQQQSSAIAKLARRSRKSWDYRLGQIAQQELAMWPLLTKHLAKAARWRPQYAAIIQPLIDVLAELAASPQADELALQKLQQWQAEPQTDVWQQVQHQLTQFSHLVPEVRAQQLMQRGLIKPAQQIWQLIAQRAKRFIAQQWKSQVYDYYQQFIAHQFPLTTSTRSRSSTVGLQQLSHLLQPDNGLLWQFQQTYVVPVNKQLVFNAQWQQRMQQAQHLSRWFFNQTQQTPQLVIELQPIPNPRLQEFRLIHNQQVMRYQNEPQRWVSLTWPPQDGSFVTALGARLANGHWLTGWEFDGIWGLFQLLAQAELIQLDDRTVRANWTISRQGKQKITVSMRLRTTLDARALIALFTDPWQLPANIFS